MIFLGSQKWILLAYSCCTNLCTPKFVEKPHEVTVLTNTNALKLNSSYKSQDQGNRIKDTVFMMFQKNVML